MVHERLITERTGSGTDGYVLGVERYVTSAATSATDISGAVGTAIMTTHRTRPFALVGLASVGPTGATA
jgi:hypothetical protein